ncbi:MAG TPA: aldehyde dehydrogenase family protein [Acidimicrobiia bacterium]|nr:aldehyde dehydrogenase family protein [Acidimicrobiia bacterium]
MTDVTPTPVADIPDTVKRLRATFAAGRTRSLDWRLEQLSRLRTMLVEREQELLAALLDDLGKPPTEAYATEIGFTVAEIDYVRKHLAGWMRPEKVHTPLLAQPGRARLHREPVGVVLVIAPWNYPVQLLLAPLVGAIAAGNCVVLKPSEVAANVSRVLGRIVPEYLDTECVAVVEGAVAETTALLAERFDHIFYTGNGTVGRVVMEAAAKHLTPVTLELGGKSPAIVDRHADLDVAARRIAWGKYLNAGQTCVAPDYVLVDAELHDALITDVREAVRSFYGDDPRRSPDYARIINDRHFERLERLVDDGAIAFGGDRDAHTRYFAPTALRDVRPDTAVMHEEIFGPILPILPVDDVGAAIEFVNERDKPLALYVFSESEAVQQRVVEETTSGGVCVNGTLLHLSVPELPFGGVGPSGMGAYHGHASFDTFSHKKGVLTKSTRVDPDVAYPPYTRLKRALIRRFM